MQHANVSVTVAQHQSVQANAMAVDCNGKYAILGTRRHLILIDLDNPLEIFQRINRQSKWDITHVTWNPCLSKKEYFVATYSQWADLWKWSESSVAHLATLRGHTRVISDVDWSPCDDTLLATCSIDTYIYVWDTRDTKRPKMTPSSVAGASQVKWNKMEPHTLATAHDGDIRIWDIRNDRTPVKYITAHLSKIHSLDWSPADCDTLASSGQDTTVRFWDTSEQSLHPTNQISAGAPVWKARYTPFGYGMVTALMPQMHRWDNSILLWNVHDVSSVVHSYVGHRDVILDFGWRYNPEDNTCAELVTWSKDHSLRLWKSDSALLTACGCTDMDEEELLDDELDLAGGDHEPGLQMSLEGRRMSQPLLGQSAGSDYGLSRTSETLKSMMLTPRSGSGSFRPHELLIESPSARYSTSPAPGSFLSPHGPSSTPPGSLDQEFKLMNIDLPNIYVEEVDLQQRNCTVLAQSGYHAVKLSINFPGQYPNNTAPMFRFVPCLGQNSLSQSFMVKLKNMLHETAQNHVRRNMSCLEPCLRMLSSQMDNITHSDLTSQEPTMANYPAVPKPVGYSVGIFGTYQHLVNIPFPRTSGARFCGAGHLVTFMRPTQVKGFEASSEPTPRCLAALMAIRTNKFSPKLVGTGLPLGVVQSGLVQFGTSPTADNSEISVKSFYYKEKRTRKSLKYHMKDGTASSSDDKLQMRLHKAAGKVVIQDLSLVLHLNRKLAEAYTVPTKHNYIKACRRNKAAAEELGRDDLSQLWSSLELLQSSVLESSPNPSTYRPWAATNFGKEFLCSLMDHYSRLGDVQTLAMISCMFCQGTNKRQEEKNSNPWHIIHSPIRHSTSFNSFENDSNGGSHRSNSFCENPADPWWSKLATSPGGSNFPSFMESPSDDYRYLEPPAVHQELTELESHEKLHQLLDCDKQAQYDSFKQAYADILDRWRLLDQRTEILKYKSTPMPIHTGLEFLICCQYCEADTKTFRCSNCKRFAMQCSLCQEPVKSLINFCILCGHGGHADHMDMWFETNSFCATGCGCECQAVVEGT